VNRDRLTVLAFALIVLFGGLNALALRFTIRELPPFWAGGLRFAAAAVFLLLLVAVQRLPIPRGRALSGALAYGIIGFGAGYAFAYLGFQHVSAGLGMIVLAVTPLFAFGLAVLHGQESFRWRPLLGGVIALAGIAVMFSGSVGAAVPLPSLLAVVAFALCNAEASVVVKQFPKSHPITTNGIGLLAGAVILLVLSLVFREPRPLPTLTSTWVALAYLIFIGSSTLFILFLFVLKSWPVSTVSYMFVLFPIVAVALSVWLEGTPLTPALGLGGSTVLLGVFVGALTQTPFVRTPHRVGPEPCLTCPE
jgi:drug/metabolite transporter (DMT)-like permease